jgi:hypothetical protein
MSGKDTLRQGLFSEKDGDQTIFVRGKRKARPLAQRFVDPLLVWSVAPTETIAAAASAGR